MMKVVMMMMTGGENAEDAGDKRNRKLGRRGGGV